MEYNVSRERRGREEEWEKEREKRKGGRDGER